MWVFAALCSLLLIYGLYHSQHQKNYHKAIQCLEHGLALKPHDVTVSLLLAAKGAVFSCMDKYNIHYQDPMRPFFPSKKPL